MKQKHKTPCKQQWVNLEMGHFIFYPNPPPPSPGAVGTLFRRRGQNFEPLGCKLQRFRQQKTRVSESGEDAN